MQKQGFLGEIGEAQQLIERAVGIAGLILDLTVLAVLGYLALACLA